MSPHPIITLLSLCWVSVFVSQTFNELQAEPIKPPKADQLDPDTSTEQDKATDKENFSVKKMNEAEYQIGKIKFNAKNKEISFRVELGEPENIIEYLLVNENGKIHETLFITDIKPLYLNYVLKLLKYTESKHLFRILDKNYAATEDYHQETKETIQQSQFDLFVCWTEGKKKREEHVNKLIFNLATKKHAEIKPYVYGGSYLLNGRFKAQLSGDIIAIFTDRSAVANFSNAGRENDKQWFPNTKMLPAKNVALTLKIKKPKPTKTNL